MTTHSNRKEDCAIADLKQGTELKGSQGRCWKVGEKLGQGRCCVAYKGALVGEDIQSAVKVFNPQPNFAAACRRESKLLDILHQGSGDSKYLVKKLDEFQHNENEVLVCELLGDSLHFLLAHHVDDKMSLWMIQKLLYDILRGLELLHMRGFVHADVKPGNIHWCPKEYCAKLIDFGLSFHIQEKVKGVVQSTHYRAPESGILAGACNIDSPTKTGQIVIGQPSNVKTEVGSTIVGSPKSLSMPSDGSAEKEMKAGDTRNSATKSMSRTLGLGDIGINQEILNKKPGMFCSDIISAMNTSTAQNKKTGIDLNILLPLYQQGGRTDFSPGIFQHQVGVSSPELRTFGIQRSNRHGVVHHRPMNPTAVVDTITSTNLATQNQGVLGCGAISHFTPAQGNLLGTIPNVSSTAVCNSSQVIKPGVSSSDNMGGNDIKTYAKSNEYSALTELSRITKTVCNCVTCGRHLSCAIDIWSVGCLVLEMFLGRRESKFGGRSKCDNCHGYDSQMLCKASVDGSNLIRSREEDDDINERAAVIKDLKDLVQRCLMCQSTGRISVAAALCHPFFQHKLSPSYRDMLLLPSCILCLLNMLDDSDLENEDDYSDIEDDIQEECERYGEVEKCVLCTAGQEKCKVFVQFMKSKDCVSAWKCLNGKTFNSRTVITCYYPLDKFQAEILKNS